MSIDWNKYPDLCTSLQVGQFDECGNAIVDVEQLVEDTVAAERERFEPLLRFAAEFERWMHTKGRPPSVPIRLFDELNEVIDQEMRNAIRERANRGNPSRPAR